MAAPCVLLIDDSPEDVATLGRWLHEAGYQVMCAEDGVEALSLLHRGPLPFLILLDLLMPAMDGWEFRERQLAEPELAHIPVVVTTVLTEEYQRQNELRAYTYLAKPISREELLAVVGALRPPDG